MASRWEDPMRKKREEEREAASAGARQADSAGQEEGQAITSVTPDVVARARDAAEAQAPRKSAFETYEAEIIKPDVAYMPASGVLSNGKIAYDFSHLSQGGLNDAARMSAMIPDDSERKNFLSQVDSERENRTRRARGMNALNGIALLGLDGNAINANTADASTVIKGINLIADDDERARARDAFLTLTKTPGSRFYGMELGTDSLGTFLDSAALQKSDYNATVRYYGGLFYGDGQHDEEDAHRYLSEYADIITDHDSAYARSQLIYALDKAYTAVTGAAVPPPPQEPQEEEEEARQEEAQEAPQQTEEPPQEWPEPAPGAISEATSEWQAEAAPRLEDAGVTVPYMNGAYDRVSPENRVMLERYLDSPRGQEMLREREKDGAEGADDAQADQTGAQGAGVAGAAAPSAGRVGAGAIGLGMAGTGTPGVGLSSPGGLNASGYVPVEDDGDVAAALMSGRYDRVAPEDRKTFDLYLKSPTARKALGVFEADQADVDNTGAENVVRRNMGALGQTAYSVMEMIESEDFPSELYGIAVATMARLGFRADELEQQGLLGGDESLPLLERLLTTDEDAVKEVQNLYDARDALLSQQAQMREQTHRQSEQTLREARIAVRNGTASDEQRQLVVKNADVTPYELYSDGSYFDAMLEVGAYFASPDGGESAYEGSAVARGVSACGVVDDAAYRASLEAGMGALLEEDATLAHSLGLSLEAYYAASGGMSMDTLCQRAATRMSRQGASITQEDRQALEMPYGEGVGAGVIIGLSLRYGTQEFFASYGEALYMGLTQMNVVRTAGKMQLEYSQKYGTFGREVYRRDLLDLANSGTVSQEFADALKRALDETGDIFGIGIDPEAYGLIREGSSNIRKDQEPIYTYVRKNGTEGENRAFALISNMTTNAWQAGTETAVTAITGNAKLGFAVGYSALQWNDSYRARLSDGYRMKTAAHLASVDTLGSCFANVGTFEGIYGRITGLNALQRSGFFSAMQNNPSGAIKGLASIRRYSVSNALFEGGKAFVQNTLDEAVVDEFKEGVVQQIIDKTIAPLFRLADAGEEIGMSDVLRSLLNVTDVDVVGVAEDVKDSFVDAAVTSSLFSLAGAVGAGIGGYRSVKSASDIAAGKSQDVSSFVDAAKQDLEDEAFCARIDELAQNARADEETASSILMNRGEDGLMDRAARARAQQQRHEQQAEASTAAMRSALAIMDSAQAKRDQGDLSLETAQEIVDAGMAFAKHKAGLDEHTRAARQKKKEADDALGGVLQTARANAQTKLRKEYAQAMDAIRSDRRLREADLDRRIEQFDGEISDIERRLVEANEIGLDEEKIGHLLDQMETLQIERDDLTREKAAGRTDAQTAHATKQKTRKQLGQKMETWDVIGKDAGEADGTSDLLSDPVSQEPSVSQTQELAKRLYDQTGVELVVAPLAEHVRALYDRETGRLMLSSRMGTGERARQVVMHELTHYIENTSGYDQYAQSALEAAYDGDETAMKQDAQEIRARYGEAGIHLGEDGVYSELVAQATERVIDAASKMTGTDSENLVYDLLGKRMSFPVRVFTRLNQFLAKLRAQRQGTVRQYDALVKARDNLKTAIAQAGKWQKGMGERNQASEEAETDAGRPQMQFAIEYDRNNRPYVVVEEDILEGVPKEKWVKTARDVLKDKFLNGIELKGENVLVTGKSRREITGSNYTDNLRNHAPDQYADKLRAVNNMDEMVRAAQDYVPEEPNHERKDDIIGFQVGKVIFEIGSNAYRATVAIAKTKSGQKRLHDILKMEKTRIEKEDPAYGFAQKRRTPTDSGSSSDLYHSTR